MPQLIVHCLEAIHVEEVNRVSSLSAVDLGLEFSFKARAVQAAGQPVRLQLLLEVQLLFMSLGNVGKKGERQIGRGPLNLPSSSFPEMS